MSGRAGPQRDSYARLRLPHDETQLLLALLHIVPRGCLRRKPCFSPLSLSGRTESAQAEPNSTAPHPATFSTARRRHEPLPDKPTLPSSTSGRCRCETLFFLRKRRGAVLSQLELEKRSFVKITERTYEKRAHALHRRRESTILRRHLLDKVPVSDLCEENGLQPRKRPTIQIVRDAR